MTDGRAKTVRELTNDFENIRRLAEEAQSLLAAISKSLQELEDELKNHEEKKAKIEEVIKQLNSRLGENIDLGSAADEFLALDLKIQSLKNRFNTLKKEEENLRESVKRIDIELHDWEIIKNLPNDVAAIKIRADKAAVLVTLDENLRNQLQINKELVDREALNDQLKAGKEVKAAINQTKNEIEKIQANRKATREKLNKHNEQLKAMGLLPSTPGTKISSSNRPVLSPEMERKRNIISGVIKTPSSLSSPVVDPGVLPMLSVGAAPDSVGIITRAKTAEVAALSSRIVEASSRSSAKAVTLPPKSNEKEETKSQPSALSISQSGVPVPKSPPYLLAPVREAKKEAKLPLENKGPEMVRIQLTEAERTPAVSKLMNEVMAPSTEPFPLSFSNGKYKPEEILTMINIALAYPEKFSEINMTGVPAAAVLENLIELINGATSKIRKLCLANTKLTDADVVKLMEGIKNNSECILTELDIRNDYRKPDFNNDLGPASMAAIGSMLAKNKSLTRLVLNWNTRIKDEGVRKFVENMGLSNTTLAVIELTGCGITDAPGLAQLAAGRDVKLSGNELSSAGVDELVLLIKESFTRTLATLAQYSFLSTFYNFHGMHLGDAGIEKIINLLTDLLNKADNKEDNKGGDAIPQDWAKFMERCEKVKVIEGSEKIFSALSGNWKHLTKVLEKLLDIRATSEASQLINEGIENWNACQAAIHEVQIACEREYHKNQARIFMLLADHNQLIALASSYPVINDYRVALRKSAEHYIATEEKSAHLRGAEQQAALAELDHISNQHKNDRWEKLSGVLQSIMPISVLDHNKVVEIYNANKDMLNEAIDHFNKQESMGRAKEFEILAKNLEPLIKKYDEISTKTDRSSRIKKILRLNFILSSNQLTDKGVQRLAKFLRKWDIVASLDLCQNPDMQDQGIMHLAEGLMGSQVFREISLNDLTLSVESIGALGKALATCGSFRELSFENVIMGFSGLDVLITALDKKKLSKLTLNNIWKGREDAKESKVSNSKIWLKFCNFLKMQHDSLTSLRLGGSELNDVRIIQLGLRHLELLSFIWLRGEKVTSIGIREVFSALEENKGIKKRYSVEKNSAPNEGFWIRLYSNPAFTVEEAQYIVKKYASPEKRHLLLAACRYVDFFYLKEIYPAEDYIRLFCATLDNVSLKKGVLSLPSIGCADEALRKILQYWNNPQGTIHELVISGNGLRFDDFQALVEILLKDPEKLAKIEKLVISGNPIGNEGCKSLVRLIAKMPNLDTLDCCEIGMTRQGFHILCIENGKRAHPIGKINFSGNNILADDENQKPSDEERKQFESKTQAVSTAASGKSSFSDDNHELLRQRGAIGLPTESQSLEVKKIKNDSKGDSKDETKLTGTFAVAQQGLFSIKRLTGKESLQKEAILYGYECKDMKNDGNCFFHAVSDQLARQEDKNLHYTQEDLRSFALEHIIDNVRHYRDSIDGDINEYISTIMEDGAWADGLLIPALSRFLNINIVIIRSDGKDPTVFKQPLANTVIVVGYEVGIHYQSLIRNPDLKPSKSIDDYIRSAEVDRFEEITPASQVSISQRNVFTENSRQTSIPNEAEAKVSNRLA